jgi:hypothetical protein
MVNIYASPLEFGPGDIYHIYHHAPQPFTVHVEKDKDLPPSVLIKDIMSTPSDLCPVYAPFFVLFPPKFSDLRVQWAAHPPSSSPVPSPISLDTDVTRFRRSIWNSQIRCRNRINGCPSSRFDHQERCSSHYGWYNRYLWSRRGSPGF